MIVKINNNEKNIIIEKDNIKITLQDEIDGIIDLMVDNNHIAHTHIDYFGDRYNELYETIKYYLDDYKEIINYNKKFRLK